MIFVREATSRRWYSRLPWIMLILLKSYMAQHLEEIWGGFFFFALLFDRVFSHTMLPINFFAIPPDPKQFDFLCADIEFFFSLFLGVLNYNWFVNYLALLESDEIVLELFLPIFGVLYNCASV